MKHARTISINSQIYFRAGSECNLQLVSEWREWHPFLWTGAKMKLRLRHFRRRREGQSWFGLNGTRTQVMKLSNYRTILFVYFCVGCDVIVIGQWSAAALLSPSLIFINSSLLFGGGAVLGSNFFH